ncbi:ShlB/FhaC/HecB family hemolysin secretion/activation protein [Ideonella sp. 4Y16]|uniref:ShlB/FhaC/HecB family hemolysin secretion/activation protein n=1 Tax=Ideonella alba TaxID=2824118 RepID=UPI001B392F85|nr:ShlB/FhaC/HecB family hemolysin secretion/activation protein [Ideonella alba]MBQ0944183.1 ShlB/FhaC/HecB family hemolysin secretion/activation protein [Ideonella alba]
MTLAPVPTRLALALASALLVPAALAQTGAGMQLQQPVPPQPQLSDPVLPAPASAPAVAAPSGSGLRTALRSITVSGNTLIDAPSLLAALGPLEDRLFDLAGLQALAQAVTQLYRDRGYPFTQTVLPPQSLASGELRLQVIEGVYGRITPVGDDPLVPGAQPFLDAHLAPGDAIHTAALERAMLLLNDQPGFRVQPTLRPGQGRGEGDLVVEVARRNHWSGEVGLDNAGSRATGEYRARASVSINSPWRFGDRVALTALATDKRMWLGSAEYESPLDGRGLRGGLSLARTSYQLSGGFSALDAQGRADVLGLRLSQAVQRTQRSNLSVSLGLQEKRLHDDFGGGSLQRDKRSRLALLGLQFDHRDDWLGGGVTYGSTSLTLGSLSLDAASTVTDAVTARSAGDFQKWNLDIARIQRLGGPFSLYGRFSAQAAAKNLDASEKLGLGGFLGVRAYPLGEASGDAGWLGQMELRWDLGAVTMFALADGGRMRTNQQPWSVDSQARRSLAGAGLGLRWLHQHASVEATLSQRVRGGAPTADTADRRPRAFVVASYRFD